MKNELRLKRLGQLKYLMENHKKIFPESIFDIDAWIKPAKSKCGSAACALGSACFYPPFQKQGLRIDGYKTFDDLKEAAKEKGEDAYEYNPELNKTYYDDGYNVGAAFFGLELEESKFLFHPDHYKEENGYEETWLHTFFALKPVRKVTPKMVAERVEMLILRYKMKAK